MISRSSTLQPSVHHEGPSGLCRQRPKCDHLLICAALARRVSQRANGDEWSSRLPMHWPSSGIRIWASSCRTGRWESWWRRGTVAWRHAACAISGMATSEKRWMPGRTNSPRHGLQRRQTSCSVLFRSTCHPEMVQEPHFKDVARVRNVPAIDLRDLTGFIPFTKMISEFSSQRFRSDHSMTGEDVLEMLAATLFFCRATMSASSEGRNAQHR